MNDFVVSLMLFGALGSGAGPELPFWATANQFGIMPESNGELALLRAGTSFDESKTLQWRWGASLALRDDWRGIVPLVDELNVGLRWKKLRLDLGMCRPFQDFMASDPVLGTLSVTAGNCMNSGNARSMPGYSINLEPWDIPFTDGHLQLAGRFGDYATIDERFQQGAMMHNTAAYLLWHIGDRITLSGGLDHYTLWAGTSLEFGDQPHAFSDYLRILVGASGGSDASEGDRINSLGDHRGREVFRAEYRGDGWKLALQHDIPYEDRSGMIFRNFPDGFNTLSLSFSDKTRWVSDVVYEYHSTMNQSGVCERRPSTEAEIAASDPRLYWDRNREMYYTIVGGADNYCNNYEYRSGWTAFGRQIGAPLFYSRSSGEGTWNNLFRAHHLGISGSMFRRLPYRFMLTYSQNYGCWFDRAWRYDEGSRLDKPLHQFSSAFSVAINLLEGRLQLVPAVFYDAGDALEHSFACTMSIKYNIVKH